MVTVLCMDIEPETLARLQRHRKPPILREAASPEHLIAAIEHDPTSTEAVLLGKEVENPLQLVQHTHALDEDLAVVLLARPDILRTLREAVGFLPSLGGDISCADAEDIEALPTMVEEAAKRTQRRRILRALVHTSEGQPGPSLRHPFPAPFLMRVLDHVPAGVVVLNPRGLVQTSNPVACDLFELRERDVVGRALVLLFLEADWERLSDFLTRSSATERRVPGQVFLYASPSGRKRWIEVTAVPFLGIDRERGALVFLQDKSLLQRYEEERRGTDPVRQETQRLEGLASFAGVVAHHFNNLLVPIPGNADLLLQDQALEPAARSVLERILEGSRRAAEIADQLLTFAGRRISSPELLDVNEAVSAALQPLEGIVPSRVALTVELGSDLPAVSADPELVQQILKNLVLHASGAVGADAGRIHVSTGCAQLRPTHRLLWPPRFQPSQDPFVYFEVTDDARMAPAARLQTFDRRPSSRSGGADLKLAAVLGAVRSQGSALEVDFPPQGGMSFRILFLPPNAPACSGGEDPGSERTVLIIDDEENVRSLTQHVLARNGVCAMTAPGVREGLEILRSRGSDVEAVLLDAGLASASDEADLEEFKRSRPDLPVILCSSQDRGRAATILPRLSAAGFLQKPFTVDLLVRAVRDVLRNRSGSGTTPAA